MTEADRSHFFDFETRYCRQCGMAVQDAIEARALFCYATDNVVAISHRVRGSELRRFATAREQT